MSRSQEIGGVSRNSVRRAPRAATWHEPGRPGARDGGRDTRSVEPDGENDRPTPAPPAGVGIALSRHHPGPVPAAG